MSTGKQHPANQKDEIERFAARKNITVNRWVVEVASGSKSEKDRKLGRLLKTMQSGDILIITEISRLSRTLTEIMSIMGRCLEKGIILYTTKEGYTFDNTINSKVLCFAFGLVAEIERNLISMRTKEALAMRKAEGVRLGRRPGSYTKTNILMENSDRVISRIAHMKPAAKDFVLMWDNAYCVHEFDGPFVPFADLYFINTEFLPLLSSSFLPRMGASGHQLNLSIASVRFSSSFSLPLSWRRISRTAPFSSCSRSASPLSRRPNSPPRSTQNSQSLSPLRSPPRRVR